MRYSNQLSRIFLRMIVGAAVGCSYLILSACGDRNLWMPVDVDGEVTLTPQSIASLTVKFDANRLRPPRGERISIALPGDSEITAVLTAFETGGDDQFIWRGVVVGEPGGTVTFSVREGRLVGNIHTARGAIYSIRYVREGIALVEKLDPMLFPREEGSGGSEPTDRPERPIGLEVDVDPATGRIRRDLAVVRDQPHVLIGRLAQNPPAGEIVMVQAPPLNDEVPVTDVMVLYTQAVVSDYGNDVVALLAQIDLMISDTKTAFKDSGVSQSLRLAHVEITEYTEKDDLLQDWQTLKGNPDVPQLGELIAKKRDYNADVVVLLTKPVPSVSSDIPVDSCGQADQMLKLEEATCTAAYAVVPINCATNRHSFSHEIGHIMGATHGRGFVAASGAWYTVMAYPAAGCDETKGCQRILRWSNPALSFAEFDLPVQGQPPSEVTGSTSANNAEALNLPAVTVSKYSDECAVSR